MSRRPFAVVVLTAALVSLAACAESATQPSSRAPGARARLDVSEIPTCRTGWNSSTGRCN